MPKSSKIFITVGIFTLVKTAWSIPLKHLMYFAINIVGGVSTFQFKFY
jgi:hypothetical protein